MSDINFLDDKRPGEDDRPKDGKPEELVWSKPEKKANSAKSSVFSFLPFSGDKKPASPIDKNKIKRSRQEILSLIKHHGSSTPPFKAENKSFLAALAEKFKKPGAPKQALIDYQQIINRKKEQPEQIGKVFNVKPLQAEKVKPVPVQPFINKNEEPPAEVKKIKITEPAPVPKNETKRRILKTNLIKGEVVTFFDWRAKIVISVISILAPLALVGAIYYGLIFYQKSSQARNSAQEQRFAELKQEIAEAEAGLKEILDFQFKLKTVSKIFKQHLYWTNFFKFLEDNMIKDVYFANFNGDTSGNYVMEAAATDYGKIVEQIKVFRDNKKVTTVLVNGGELVTGEDKNKSSVKFTFNFSILKSIFTE